MHVIFHAFTLSMFLWHLVFDGIGNFGSYKARKFCQHWWHRAIVVSLISLATTFALVSLVG